MYPPAVHRGADASSSRPIEDYALIGDGKTAALVARDGSIDWLCWPRFDGEACFAALLGRPENGYWILAPAEQAETNRQYRRDTMVVETCFRTGSGSARMLDFMPVDTENSSVIRIVEGIRGTVSMHCSIVLRFDYGLIRPLVATSATETIISAGSLRVVLRTTVPVTASSERIEAQFDIAAGQRITFTMTCANWVDPFPEAVDPAALLTATEQFWRRWISRFTKQVVEPDAVRRSLLTLKALTHHRTGGLVAAPTLGLPERLGGSLNWDYRFCWLRDATFTLTALLNAGYHEEATEWYKWLLRAAGSSGEQLQVLYRVDGSRSVHEYELPWLSGYEGSQPVRAGNAAAAQRQLDIFGEVIDALCLAARAGIKPSPHDIDLQAALVDHIGSVWEQPDKGLWEARGEARNFTYSRVMAWVGVDRFIQSPAARACVKPGRLRRLRVLAKRIHDQVCTDGYDGERGHFVEYYGSSFVDGSLLLLPLLGFLPIDDPRITATIDVVERELMADGLVRRRHATSTGEQEGAFIPCTCWLADCRAMQGRSQEARKLLTRVLEVRNDVGLFAEEYDTAHKRLLGNFPQALSHLALINTELQLSGPVLQRDGG